MCARLVFRGVSTDGTLADRTLFWMASGWYDFKPQSVLSVFACGQKTGYGWLKKLHSMTAHEKGILCAVGGEDILSWNNTLNSVKPE